MSRNKLVPKLRFGEFEDEWKECRLNDLFEFFPTNSFSRDKLNYEEGEVQNIHYGDIHTIFPNILDYDNNIIPFINNNVDLSKIKEASYCVNGDLIIADASEDYADIGKATEIINIPENKKVVAGLHTILARNKNNSLVEGFKGYLFLNEDLRLKIKIIANGISVLGISKSNLGNLEVKIPSIKEQDKIASFLSIVDKKLNLLNDKLVQIQYFKNFLLRNIFSQKIRFKEFDCEWEECYLKDLLESSSSNLSLNDLKENEGKYGLYDATGIVKSIDFCEKTEPYLAIVKDGAGVGRIFLCEPNTSVIGTMQYLTPKEDIDLTFSYYLLNTIEFRKYVVGSTIPHIYFKDYSKEEILVPQIEEQEKIASILSCTDNKLNLIQEQLSLMEEFKKSLLEQMFI